MMWNNQFSGGDWLAMVALMAPVWLLLSVGVVLAYRLLDEARAATNLRDVLDERLARGEIDMEEYRDLWGTLVSRPTAGPRP